jgi:uncharacterized damage-inducible protein DinB
MNANEALIESWKRQCRCTQNVAGLLDAQTLELKASEDGWTVAYHLCHIHETRSYWLYKATGEKNDELIDLYHQVGEEWFPSSDLDLIREQLNKSESAITGWMEQALASSKEDAGPYDHPVLFLQHMVWHEGYHFALLTLALRLAGKGPSEDWEEKNVWDLWRRPE